MASVLLAFATAGRRDTLAPAVQSLVHNALEHGHEPRVVIATDAAGAVPRPVRDAVAALDEPGRPRVEQTGRQGSRVRSRVIDIAARRGLVTRIADSVGNADLGEALEFALVPEPDARRLPGPGCNHNALLLATAGELYVSTDDDVVAEPALGPGAAGPATSGAPDAEEPRRRERWPDASDGASDPKRPAPRTEARLPDGTSVEVTLSHLAHGLRFHADRRAAAADVIPVARDIVGSHLALAGRTGAEVFGPDVATAASGRVLISTAGAYGDSGMGSPRTVLALSGADRDHACATDERYRGLRLSRALVRSSPVTRVGPSTHLMLMQAAMDNRVVLPPHFPIGRNSDGLFAVMVRIVHPGSLTGFQDFALRHEPPEEHVFATDEIHRWRPYPTDLVMHLVVALAPSLPATDAADRLVALGTALEEIASGSTSEFVSTVHGLWLNTATHHTEQLEGLLERYERRPETWAADVVRFNAAAYEMMQEPGSLFGEVGCGMSAEELRKAVGRYGRVLAVWPRAWEEGVRAGSAWR